MKKILSLCALAAIGAAHADYDVRMSTIDDKGVGASVGTVHVSAAPEGGVMLAPQLKGLPPGSHGFHLHEVGNCGAKEANGKMEPGALAGGHFDPQKTKAHAGPDGSGHLGDLPALVVAPDGGAMQAVTAKRLTLKDFEGKSLVVHEGGDNSSDQPKPNGGGGARIACGVVEASAPKS